MTLLLVNGIIFGVLALIWSKKDIVNFLCKAAFLTMAILNLVHYLH